MLSKKLFGILLVITLSVSLSAQIESTGCGIGFWKNHPDNWISTGYIPDQSVESVFSQAAAYPDIAASTLMQAFSFHGGKGVEGAARILVRQGVAAVLNAAHPDVNYARTLNEVITSVDGALSGGDSSDMHELAEALDEDNEGICELKAKSPAVDIEKFTNGHNADNPTGPVIKVGDPVEWTYIIENKGDARLINIQVVDDQGVTVNCPQTELDPDESMTCTAQGVAVLGQYSNLGTVTAETEQGLSVNDSDPSHYLGVENIEGEGCSLGYWKNHSESWLATGYTPDQIIATVFIEAARFPDIGSATLMEALKFRGGSGVEGGARLLLRTAVAAILNAAHPEIDFPFTETEVINDVDAALASEDRDQMIPLFEDLDYNIDLICPLSDGASPEEEGFILRKTKKNKVNKNK